MIGYFRILSESLGLYWLVLIDFVCPHFDYHDFDMWWQLRWKSDWRWWNRTACSSKGPWCPSIYFEEFRNFMNSTDLCVYLWMRCCLIKVMPHCGQLAEYSRLVGHFIWYRMYSIQVVPGPCSSSMSTLLTKHANLFGHPFDQLGRLDLYRNRIADTGVGRLAEAGFANHDLPLDLLTWFWYDFLMG